MTDSLGVGPRPRLAGTAFANAAVLAVAFTLSVEADGPRLVRTSTLDLPEEVATASDVRLRNDGSLLLGVGGNGIYFWEAGARHAELVVTLAGSGFGVIQDYSNVGGSSSGSVAFSSSAYGVYRQDENGIRSFKEVEIVGDVDRRHARTVAVGLSRSGDGDYEDRLAWLISEDGTVRGILPRRAAETSHWSLAGALGVARIVSEDRVLIIPGIEPGVFVYHWDGRLLDALGTGTFFADSPWRVSAAQEDLLTETSWFRAWLSRHRIIDEAVVDDRGNVFFFVRHVPTNLPYPTHVASGPQGRITGGLTVVDRTTGNLRPVPLSDAQVAQMVELIRDAGHDIGSEERLVREGTISDRALLEELGRIMAISDIPPPRRTTVCWDLVHAHIDDLEAATKADCVIEAEIADARLRADLRGDKAVILLRGDTYGAVVTVRPSEAFEARLVPPQS
ncbi:MAG: hypothetical protein F4X59_02245 [Holophagales bacterium]|nr:hypothetical protein [Holophagales bacterium]MYC08932.1 hypothetical protein [Holophagales bacterium]